MLPSTERVSRTGCFSTACACLFLLLWPGAAAAQEAVADTADRQGGVEPLSAAAGHYRRSIEMWSDADEEFQPLLLEVSERLSLLGQDR